MESTVRVSVFKAGRVGGDEAAGEVDDGEFRAGWLRADWTGGRLEAGSVEARPGWRAAKEDLGDGVGAAGDGVGGIGSGVEVEAACRE